MLCEKPLCLSPEEYGQIAEEEEGCQSGGPYAFVVFQHRYGSGAARDLSPMPNWQTFYGMCGRCDEYEQPCSTLP